MAAEFLTVFKTSQIAPGAVVLGATCEAFESRSPTSAARITRLTTPAHTSNARSTEQGELADTTITCTCHNSEFDVRTGKVLAPPALIPAQGVSHAH